MYDDKNYESALRSASVSNISMVSIIICTPSEISRELRHNHDIDHWSDRLTAAFDRASTSSTVYSGS